MTIKQLADQEGISKAGARHILAQLGLLDQLERDDSGVLQVTDDQAEAVHAHRHRKEPAESSAESNREPESADRKAEPESNRIAAVTDRLLALLEQDLQTMREQLAAKDAEVLALRQQLEQQADLLKTLSKALEAATGTTLATSGQKLLEADNQQRGRLRRAWDALRGR